MGLLDLFTGDFLTGRENGKALDYMRDATGAFNGLGAPQLSPIDLERYGYAGDVDPRLMGYEGDVNYAPIDAQLAELSQMGPSAYEQVNTDPRLRDSQAASLSALEDLAASGGMNGTDKANLSRIQTDAATADRGRRQAIQQGMASRGMGGSGMDLLAQLQSSQAATDSQAQQGLDVAGMAQSRALDAMMKSGQMAGDIRGQDYAQMADKARARDAISQFNTQNRNQNSQWNAGQRNSMSQFNAGNQLRTDMSNRDARQGVSQFNTAAQNQAAYGNRDARQGWMNANTDTGNKQTMYNAGLGQQDFENQYKIAAGKSGAAKTGMDYWQHEGDKKRDAWGNIIQGGAMVAAK